jgi:thiamine biosynthesis lipoprotein
MKRSLLFPIGFLILLVLLFVIRNREQPIKQAKFEGFTMGTLYHISVIDSFTTAQKKDLAKKIDEVLKRVNVEMSTWDPKSEISQFNHKKTVEPVSISEPFSYVVRRALKWSKETHGAFDPTLQPLLDLWGFGSESKERKVPSDVEIKETEAKIGWEKLSCPPRSPPILQKSIPDLALNLGAIAKGYGVDQVAQLLKKEGYTNWFVEIGGEVIVQGKNAEGNSWRIGVQYPTTNPAETRSFGILHFETGAIATSGSYRNFIVKDEKIYSHILDPRTGRALYSSTLSVSVYAPNCADADAIATALFVMGNEEGLKWVEKHPQIEALFLVQNEAGEICEKKSSSFVERTGYIIQP